MTRILAIDPGPTESAYVVTNGCRIVETGKCYNDDLLSAPLLGHYDDVAIEMIASYGMAVGAEVFDTCVWIGRFYERSPVEPQLVYRRDIKLHHCGSTRAKDANITQALIDRFAPGTPNKGKGTKADPGFFYGFKADIWQAMALAVYVADTKGTTP